MRLYIAGSTAEIDRVRIVMRAVTQLGHGVTYDWPACVREFGSNPVGASDDDRRRWVDECFAGVDRAELVWLLSPGSGTSFGVGAELGYAYRSGKPMIASGPGTRLTIFTSLAQAFPTDRAALEWIGSAARLPGTLAGQ